MKTANPNTLGAWSDMPSLDIARSHPSVCSYEGKIYAFGGGGPNFKSLDSVVCYDPKDNSWTDLKDMPTRRSGTVAAVMGDDIYVMAGGFKQENGTFRFLTKVEIYHPKTDSWSDGPDLNQPHDYPAVAILDGMIYVLAGHHPDATQGGPKTDPGFDFCERLKPGTDSWEVIATMPTPRFALSAIVRDNKIYAMGGVAFRPEGFDNFTTIECYNPTTNSWSEDKNFALPWPAAGLGSTILDGELYVFGGYSDIDIHNRVARLDSKTGEWELVAPMPSPVCAMGAAVCDGVLYSIGGWADDGRTPLNRAYSYHP